MRIVDPTDYLDMKAGVHQIRGEILAAWGQTEEARAELEHAVRDFARKGAVPAIERAAPSRGAPRLAIERHWRATWPDQQA